MGLKKGGRCEQRAVFFLRGPSYRPFCPKFRCHGKGGQSGVNINDTVKLVDPENHTLEPKITTLSYT